MKNILSIIQIILSLLLIALVFLQANNSPDNKSNFISDTNVEKRGWEKITFVLTIVILAIFVLSSIIQILL